MYSCSQYRATHWTISKKNLTSCCCSAAAHTHGCQPTKTRQRLASLLASWIRCATCPLTLSAMPSSSIPCSFCCSRFSTCSAILREEDDSMAADKLDIWLPLLVWVPCGVAVPSACSFLAFTGLTVHWYRGSYSKTYAHMEGNGTLHQYEHQNNEQEAIVCKMLP